jgi:hypothetical protein
MLCRRVFAVVAALALASCGKCGGANDEQLLPKLPPGDASAVGATISVAVTISGKPATALTAERLEATPPDFHDAERRGWRLDRLFGDAGANATYTVTGAKGVGIVLHRSADPAAAVPVLILNRRGELLATLVDPQDPFPAFHGQGGRRERPGETLPRLQGVTAIAVDAPPP